MFWFKVISLSLVSEGVTNDCEDLKPAANNKQTENHKFPLFNECHWQRVCATPTHEGVRVETITRCVVVVVGGGGYSNCNCSQFKSWRRDMSAFWIRLLAWHLRTPLSRPFSPTTHATSFIKNPFLLCCCCCCCRRRPTDFWLFVIYTRLKASCRATPTNSFFPLCFRFLFELLHNVNVWQMCHKQHCQATTVKTSAVTVTAWQSFACSFRFLVSFHFCGQRLKKLWPNKWPNGRKWQMTVNHDRPDGPHFLEWADKAKLCLAPTGFPRQKRTHLPAQWQSQLIIGYTVRVSSKWVFCAR